MAKSSLESQQAGHPAQSRMLDTGDQPQAGGTYLPALHGHFPGWAWDWFWVVAALVFGAFVLVTLGRHGIWTDELAHKVRLHDPAPWRGRLHPLHLMIARADVLLFGFSDYALRLPWAFFGIACIPLSYAVGRLLGGRTLGRIACLVMACSPYLLHYSRDANFYAEIMAYTLLGVWGAMAFIEFGALLPALIALGAMGAMSITHPISAVCAVSLGSAMLVGALGRRPLRQALAHQFIGRHRVISLSASAAFVLLAGLIAWKFGHMASNVITKAWSLLAWRGGFQNMDLSWTFLISAANEFTGGMFGVTARSLIVTAVYAVAALVGLVALVRRDFWKSLPILCPFVAMLLLLRFLKIDRFFHVRYIDYIAPLWLMLAAAGVFTIGQALARRSPSRKWLAFFPLAVLLAVQAPQLASYASFKGGYLKTVMRYLKPVIKPEDRILIIKHFGPREEAQKFGLDTKQFVPLAFNPLIPGQQRLQEAWARQFFAANPATYVLLHWNALNFIDTALRHTLIHDCKSMVKAPSVFELSSIQDYRQGLFFKPEAPVVCAELYRWNWPDRYVCVPKPLEVNLAKEAKGPGADWKRRQHLIPLKPAGGEWKSNFLFEKKGNYLVTLTSPAGLAPIPYRLKIDNLAVASSSSIQAANRTQYSVNIFGHEVELKIQAMGQAAETLAGTGWLPTLRIEPDFSRGVKLDPLYISRTNPTNDFLFGNDIGGRMVLVFDRNEGVHYDLHLTKDANYRFTFEAIEDSPGPVYFEVAIDGRPKGILSYDKADMSWSRQSMIEPLSEGDHTLTVNYLSEYDVGATDPDKNNNLALAEIEIAAAKPTDRDDRLPLAEKLTAAPAQQVAPGFASAGAGDGRAWDFLTYAGAKPKPPLKCALEPDAEAPWPGGSQVHFSIPADSTSTLLVSPTFPVEPGKIIYFRSEVRVQNLVNHSANLQLLLMDKDGYMVDVIHVRAQGITGTTPWIPYVYAEELPEDAAYATVACVIYQNGKMPAQEGGEAWFRRLEFPSPAVPAPPSKK